MNNTSSMGKLCRCLMMLCRVNIEIPRQFITQYTRQHIRTNTVRRFSGEISVVFTVGEGGVAESAALWCSVTPQQIS